jgi:gamma-glutamyltranspeptidase / glutathione hydrolase
MLCVSPASRVGMQPRSGDQTVALGVSKENAVNEPASPGGAAEIRSFGVFSVVPVSGCGYTLPQLTPWATICRPVRSWKSSIILICTLALLPVFDFPTFAQEPALYQHGAVAADHPLASQAGVEILQRGGNVIDAAVGTALTLSVVRPASSGLGGGGFLVHWDAGSKQSVAWDYRETAPLAAKPDLYQRAAADGLKDASEHGGLAVAVPGHIPGLCHILETQGRFTIQQVLETVLKLTCEGVPVDAIDLRTQRELLAEFAKQPDKRTTYSALWTGYLNAGVPWKMGDKFRSPQIAALEALSRDGVASFKTGAVAQSMLEATRSSGGILTPADFAGVHPIRREPLRAKWGDYEILTMPPPSSGGIALLQTLQALEAWGRLPNHRRWCELHELDRTHVLAEALKHAFADRAEFLGDADFVDVPTAKLISAKYAQRIAERIDLMKTLPANEYGRFQLPDDAGTTHFCVMDQHGNAVSCTETINLTYGSHVVDPKFGIVLNNEMDDFTALPGQPNAFGLIQSANNAIAPRKKPLSSMTPTIVLKDGRPVLLAGASGGPRIITATIQTVLRGTELGMTATDAVIQPRVHHQWQPHELLIERALEPLRSPLERRGHQVKLLGSSAVSQAIRWTPAGIEPASDPRKHGRPAGY